METTFKTKDLALATSLVTLGYNYLATYKEGKSGVFEFDGGAEQAATAYFSGELTVDPNRFIQNYKNLKTMITNLH